MKTTILIFAIMFFFFFVHDLCVACSIKREPTNWSQYLRTTYIMITSILFGIYFNLN